MRERLRESGLDMRGPSGNMTEAPGSAVDMRRTHGDRLRLRLHEAQAANDVMRVAMLQAKISRLTLVWSDRRERRRQGHMPQQVDLADYGPRRRGGLVRFVAAGRVDTIATTPRQACRSKEDGKT